MKISVKALYVACFRDWRSASPVFINRYSCTFGMVRWLSYT